MSNVITGPWHKLVPPEVVEKQQKQNLQEYISTLVACMSGDLFDALAENGFDIDISENIDYTKDIALMVECIRSYLMRHHDQYHPLQDVSDEFFEELKDGRLRTTKTLNIKFRGQITPN